MTSPEREAAVQRMAAASKLAILADERYDYIPWWVTEVCARIAAEEIERVHEWLAARNPPPGSDSQAKTWWWVEWSAVCPEEKPKKGWGPARLGWPTKDHPDPLEEEK